MKETNGEKKVSFFTQGKISSLSSHLALALTLVLIHHPNPTPTPTGATGSKCAPLDSLARSVPRPKKRSNRI